MKKTNKRTLKKRIQIVMSLCILISVLLISVMMFYFFVLFSKEQAIFIADYISSSYVKEMNSDYFLKQIGIKGLEEFNPNSSNAIEWLNSLASKQKDLQPPGSQNESVGSNIPDAALPNKKIAQGINKKITKHDPLPFFNINNFVYTKIELNQSILYSDEEQKKNAVFSLFPKNQISSSNQNNFFIDHFITYYSDAKMDYPLFNSSGQQIGSVTSNMNPEFLILLLTIMLLCIIAAGILSLIIANFISKFFTIPIIKPLHHLEKNIRAIANEDFENTADKQIVLKKPLREIESIANSTNKIMFKMKEYTDILSNQKTILENQNEELEAQNEDLFKSKKQIEDTQTLLVQVENMASIGQLTAAIMHEINTPLGAINSNVNLNTMIIDALWANHCTCDETNDLSELVSQLKQTNEISLMACQRVIEIIRSLKIFSQIDSSEFQEADLTESLKSVLILTSNLWKNKVTIHEEYGHLPIIKCFPGLLNQVFMNIIVNAIQSIEQKGDLFITTTMDEHSVFISIRDTGTGIKEEHLGRIFESNFSTKGGGLGLGLGLSICNDIVRRHNGEIIVNSKVGEGTEFVVRIPLII